MTIHNDQLCIVPKAAEREQGWREGEMEGGKREETWGLIHVR